MSKELWQKEERERFQHRYGVKEYKQTYRNMLQLLDQGGAPREAIIKHLVSFWGVDPEYRHFLGNFYGKGNAFDHVELWGRDGRPLILIGYPYQLGSEAFRMLGSLVELGMHVHADTHSWYGHGTLHLEVYHWDTLKAYDSEQQNLRKLTNPA